MLWLMNRFSVPVLGTSMLRETEKEIQNAGFKIVSSDYKLFDILRLIIATKEKI